MTDKDMTTGTSREEVIRILRQHNEWRRDHDGAVEEVPAQLVGKAIDAAVELLSQPAAQPSSMPTDAKQPQVGTIGHVSDGAGTLIGSLSGPIASALSSSQPPAGGTVTDAEWRVRERRGPGGELRDCFVEAPREGDMAYALEVLGDDYTGYGDVQRKLEHCKLIVSLYNAHMQSAERGKDAKDAVFGSIMEVKRTSDQSVQVVFMSCRTASEFEAKARAAISAQEKAS